MNLMQMRDGARLYVEDFGEGPAIVFICGGNLTHKSWESQVAALAGEFRTITFDWRGTGRSDKPRGGYTGEAVADDVRTIMEHLGLAPALLVGHGLGAHVALLVAYAAPALVSGLVLTGAAPWFSGEREGKAGGVSEDFLRFLISRQRMAAAGHTIHYAEACYEMGDRWVFHGRQSPGVYHTMLEQAMEWPQYVLNAYAEGMREIDHRARAPMLRTPTLILQGRHDKKQRYEGAIHLAQMISGSRLVTLENSATMANVEEVDAFNRELAQFARDLRARVSAAA
jgi:pimeloyl-ACP methyl ester carboxylesterase